MFTSHLELGETSYSDLLYVYISIMRNSIAYEKNPYLPSVGKYSEL